ncbi:hypothetical protein ENBRE01_2724 [Enteropsectra breve]|nr:hypothetical protein ENBRE01_2724 [Enteropsectra breve]
MDNETMAMLQMAHNKAHEVDEELDLQNEKYANLNKKLADTRSFLNTNIDALFKLNNAMRIRHFVFFLIFMVLLFASSVVGLRYLKWTKVTEVAKMPTVLQAAKK